MKPILGISARMWGVSLLVALTAAVLVGSQLAHSHPSAPTRERVGNPQARLVLHRAYAAARQLSRRRGLCSGCYPVSPADLSEDLYDASGIPFAVAFTPFGAHLPGVVYLDTVGADRLSHTHLTFYARTSDGTVFQLDADRGRVHLFQAE
jgi:hypothetical protein